MQLRSSGGSSLAVGVAIWLIAVAAGLAALSAAAARPGVEGAHPALWPSAHAGLAHPRKSSGERPDARRRASARLAAKFRSPSEGEVDAARKALAAPRDETQP